MKHRIVLTALVILLVLPLSGCVTQPIIMSPAYRLQVTQAALLTDELALRCQAGTLTGDQCCQSLQATGKLLHSLLGDTP